MKKNLMILFGLLIVLCLAAVMVWTLFPTILSRKLSKRVGSSVTISGIGLSPNKIKVDGIRVGNPSGYSKTPHAFSVDDAIINTSLIHFLDKKIVIDEMTIDAIYIGFEFDSPTSKNGNWKTLMNNMSQSTKDDSNKGKKKGGTTSVLIKRLVMTDLQIELAYKTGGKPNRKLRPIDRIELTDVSSKGGILTAQIINIIMREILRNIFSREGLQNILDGVLNPQDASAGVRHTLKGLLSNLILLDNGWDDPEYEELEEAQ
ncbi:MAG: hypothetical protein QNJ27_01900 [Simkaniaceae bacterium]|nr:hypothetical protein [Simkaniaceae bacterium]